MTARVINAPPTYTQMVDKDGKVTIPWALFFEQIYKGDQGNSWTPLATDLTVTGTPTFTGTYYQISSKLVFFHLKITPATDTSSVAGTTYFTGLPFTIAADGFCTAQSSNLGDPTGMVVASNQRIYTPAWTSISVPVTVTGVVEAS